MRFELYLTDAMKQPVSVPWGLCSALKWFQVILVWCTSPGHWQGSNSMTSTSLRCLLCVGEFKVLKNFMPIATFAHPLTWPKLCVKCMKASNFSLLNIVLNKPWYVIKLQLISLHSYIDTTRKTSKHCRLSVAQSTAPSALRLVLAAYCGRPANGRPNGDCNASAGRQRFVQAQSAPDRSVRIGLKFCMRSFKGMRQLFRGVHLSISKKVVFHSTLLCMVTFTNCPRL